MSHVVGRRLFQEQEWRGETIHETRLLLPPFTV